MKIKNLFKVAFCFVLMLFVIYSCEDEPVELDQSQNWTKLKHGTNDFIKRESISNYPDVMSYAKDLAKPTISDLVRTEDDNTTFTIIEHINAYIFTDSLATTYTIPILKTNQTEFGFSNLVIKYESDNPVEEFILNYVPTQSYLESYLEYDQTPFDGTILYESLLNGNARTIECNQITTTYCCFVYGIPEIGEPNFCGAYHIAGPSCNTSEYIQNVTSTVCSSTPQDFTIDAGDSNGGGGGAPTTPIPSDTCTNARGDVGLSNGDGCLESPSFTDEIIDCINTDTPNDGILLNAEQIEFLESRDDEDNMDLFEILEEGLCSEESQEFVLLAIDALDDDCNTSKAELQKVFPNMPDDNAELLASIINDKGLDFGIDTNEKLWHFLAQTGHETGGFTTLQVTENLHYSNQNLLDTWPNRFSQTDTTKLDPDDYKFDAEKLANYVYCCRMGNGSESSGEGWKYRGRGIKQMTGKSTYRNFKNWYNVNYNPNKDFVSNPNLISTNDTLAILSGLWFYKSRILDRITIDSNTTVKKVTYRINGGYVGLNQRKQQFSKVKDSITCL